MTRRFDPLFAVLASLALFAAPASAQEGEDERSARHHFRLGEAHYESGHFVEAAREFEEAYRLSNRVPLLHNVYVAYRDAGDIERAADALRRYLELAENLDNETVLRQRLAALERLIAERRAREADGDTAQPDAEPEATAPAARPATSAGGGGPSPVGFIVAGVGAAALIAGAVTGGLALGANDELASTCPDRVCPPGYDFESTASSGSALALTTDVLLPVGAVALATGVVLILVLQESDESASAGAACGPDGCVAVARGRF